MCSMSNQPPSNPATPYDSSHIKVLKGLDAVRKRPGMYIGDTDDGTGLHHLVFEVVDNSIDEALAGHCSHIEVRIHADNSITVVDNGRGIPVDIHPEEQRSAAEVIMTVLHAGGKFDDNAYKVSGGLHGVGVSVVNALSAKLMLTVDKHGKRYRQSYLLGVPEAPLAEIGTSDSNGTTIHFLPCNDIFTITEFHYETIASRLKELAFLNAGIHITLVDERQDKEEVFFYEGGITEFVQYLNTNKNPVNSNIFHATCNQDNIAVAFALQWQDGYQENIYCFTNNIKQKDGGTHLSGFRSALTRSINKYIEENDKKGKGTLVQGEDTREGLTAIVSVKMFEPKFSSQTKDKLVSSEVKSIVESRLSEAFSEFLMEHPKEAKVIMDKVKEASYAREAARKAREVSRRKNSLELSNLPGKLADCSDTKDVEVFIVEGDSAGGSAKAGRDRRKQAILPLKGKILNVEKARFDKMLANDEIAVLIKALGCGVGSEAYDPDKIRYNRIIIMTDADVDGAHIRTLLLTFFYRQMPELIERGHVYIAQPPLYKVSHKKQSIHLKDEAALDQHLLGIAIEKTTFFAESGTPPLPGLAFEKLCQLYWDVAPYMERLGHYYTTSLLHALFMCPAVSDTMLCDKDAMQQWAKSLEASINSLTVASHGMYQVSLQELTTDEGTPYFSPTLTFVTGDIIANAIHLRSSFFSSAEYQKIVDVLAQTQGTFGPTTHIIHDDKQFDIQHLPALIKALANIARDQVTIQRFKGLGEMNPEQLWETTMDPENRYLYKVRIEDAISADGLFSVLMGDNVQPRKDFIESNAHLAENIDT